MPSDRLVADELARHALTRTDDAPPGTGLVRDSLPARVRSAVLDLIDDRGLAVGDPLPSTAALAERFAVSTAVVREALSALSALGIIQVSNGRQATVRAADNSVVRFYLSRALRESPGDALSSLMDLRAPLEVRAAQLAARSLGPDAGSADGQDAGRGAGQPGTNGTAADREPARDRLRRLLADMDDALPDARRYPELDLELHQQIALLGGNHALHGILDAVRRPLFRVMQELRATREEHGLVGAEHEEHHRIVAAILAGDVAAAGAAMTAHMNAVESFERT